MPNHTTCRLGIAVIAMLMTATACTTSKAGTALSQSTTMPAATSTSTHKSDRPRDLKIDGVKPCELLTPEQREEFKIDRPFSPENEKTFQSVVCDFLSQKENDSISLYVITSRGIQEFAPGKTVAESQPTRALGFPAFRTWTVRNKPGNEFCSINVDVSDGQVLRAQYSEHGRYKNPLDREEICRRATRGAELALGNLMARG